MHWIDWLIVVVPLVIVGVAGFRTRRYMRGVSDFLAAGRVAGRYIVAVASAEAGMGLITVVAAFEMYYLSGFGVGFWTNLRMPIALIVTLTGFAVYRYRETRSMTLAQFFEVRYSKGFRVFAGSLIWISGALNYALFPAIGARFILLYCNAPQTISILGTPVSSFGLLMAVFLSVALIIVLFGGQITAMVTDCLAGIFSYGLYAMIIVAVMMIFSWSQMSEALLDRPEGMSLLDPFDTSKLQTFNVLFVLISVIGAIYGVLSWQGQGAYQVSAASAHEAKMGGVLGQWRAGYSTLMVMLLAIAAYTYMHHPDFAPQAAEVRAQLEQQVNMPTEGATATIRQQMTVPMAVRHFLPIGVSGAFFAVMMFLMVSTDVTYLHAWGTIFVQDIILPLRKKPFAPTQHIWLLRLSIVCVACLAFTFSLLFNQVTEVLMFQALTGAIWLGGAGAVILGGLYWKRGTTLAAWATLIVGSSMAGSGFILQQYWSDPVYPWLAANAPGFLEGLQSVLNAISSALPIANWTVAKDRFPITGQEISFITMICSASTYLLTSLLLPKEPFNMDRMLHRGIYARDLPPGATPPAKPPRSWAMFLGIDKNFTRGDKFLSITVFSYSMSLFVIFAVVAIWNLAFYRWSKEAWASYFWIMNVVVPLIMGAITSVWFTIGGISDLRKMFKKLSSMERNAADDGRVIGHVNAEDLGKVSVEKEEDRVNAERSSETRS